MGGPLSFLFGLGLVAAGAMQDAAKKEEMRRYNEAKKADPYLNQNRQNTLELRVKKYVFRFQNAGGINVKKLTKDLMDIDNYNMLQAHNEIVLLISKYLTETMSPYKYDRSNALYEFRYDSHNSEETIDISDYICEDWGKPLEFNPNLKRLGWMSLEGKPIEEQMYEQAKAFVEKRKGYGVGYEIFENCRYPEWLDKTYYDVLKRWKKEYGVNK